MTHRHKKNEKVALRPPGGIVFLAGGAVAAVVLFAAAALRVPDPFVWSLATLAFALVAGVAVCAPASKPVGLILFGLTTGLLLGELGFALTDPDRTIGQPVTTSLHGDTATFRRDRDLGYALIPGTISESRLQVDNRLLYDATYTVGGDGFRSTPGSAEGETWLFMGCSYTFGSGVNDSETLPAQVSRRLGNEDNVRNLGVSGYGPHQMLRMLELNRPGAERAPVKYVIYSALPEHVSRAAGLASWDPDGPWYRLEGDSIAFAGHFTDRTRTLPIRILRKSHLAMHLLKPYYFERTNPRASDVELFARIVERSSRLAREKLGAEFVVLFWDEPGPVSDRIISRLKKGGVRVIRATDFIPADQRSSFFIPWDGHPNARAYRRIAEALPRLLMAKSSQPHSAF